MYYFYYIDLYRKDKDGGLSSDEGFLLHEDRSHVDPLADDADSDSVDLFLC